MARKANPEPEPWLALGIGKTTYYRRKKAGTLEGQSVPKVPVPRKKSQKVPSGTETSKTSGGGRERGLANLKPFQPGHSGNPTGGRKADKTVKALAREHTAAAIETLASILKNEAATESSRVQAATALLDRGWGRPLQQLEVGEAGAFSDMDETALDAFIAHAATRLSTHGAGSGSRPN